MEFSAYMVSGGIFLLLWFIYQHLFTVDNDDFPTVLSPKGTTDPIAAAIAKGYQSYIKPLEKPFYIMFWTKKMLILPPKYLNDIRRASRDHLQFQPAINDMLFQYKWLEDSIKTEPNQTLIMKGINPKLPKMSGPLINEAGFVLDSSIGSNPEGKEVSVVEFANDVSIRTFSRVLGGKALSRDQKFLDAFSAWSTGNMITGFLILMIPLHAVRHTVAWPLALYQKHVRQKRLQELAKIHVLRRIKEEKEGNLDVSEVDALQIALNAMSHQGDDATITPIDLIAAQLWQLTWAGAQSPTMTLANMLVKVLEIPEHSDALRDEARAAVERQGWTDAMLSHMPLMDSFIREVQRLYPILPLNTERKVMDKAFTFSDGFTLPKDTLFAFPAASCSLDSDLIEDPLKFDPYRFVRLAKRDSEREESDNRWAASQAGATNMAFGYGNHVCPGRFLAVRGLKIIFAKILLDYELLWRRGNGKIPRKFMEGLSFPEPSLKFTIKKRKV